mgnify:CR=1 FL=1
MLKKSLILIFCTLFILQYSKVMANEEAKYEIIDKNEVYEIRKYSDRLAVETSRAGIDSNFRKLFNYISGRNETQEKIAMTTPVTQVEKKGNMTMQFYLPSKFNKENIPDPSNSNVKISTMKAGYYAVIIYSGRNSENNFIKHKNILEEEICLLEMLLKEEMNIYGYKLSQKKYSIKSLIKSFEIKYPIL